VPSGGAAEEAVARSPAHFRQADGGQAMKRTWTIIGVSDVSASFKWYQSLFGQPETLPGHSGTGVTGQWAPLVLPR
jgi:hypothetical protein